MSFIIGHVCISGPGLHPDASLPLLTRSGIAEYIVEQCFRMLFDLENRDLDDLAVFHRVFGSALRDGLRGTSTHCSRIASLIRFWSVSCAGAWDPVIKSPCSSM